MLGQFQSSTVLSSNFISAKRLESMHERTDCYYSCSIPLEEGIPRVFDLADLAHSAVEACTAMRTHASGLGINFRVTQHIIDVEID